MRNSGSPIFYSAKSKGSIIYAIVGIHNTKIKSDSHPPFNITTRITSDVHKWLDSVKAYLKIA